MQYTIHLTEKCNLNCTYCYEKRSNKEIDFENIKKLIDSEIEKEDKLTIYFYGGEPLLKKDIIRKTISYVDTKKDKDKVHYGITTNGTLLDDEFIKFMKENKFHIVGYSIDGVKKSHDLNRKMNNNNSFDIVNENAKRILKEFEYAIAMSVVTKNNLKYLSENVEYLISLGFKCINLQLNYIDDWEDNDLSEIKEQFLNVAKIYENNMLKENDIDIPIIEDKIKSYIESSNCNESCKMGIRNINVGTDGNFYPCMQFVNESKYIIGNCESGKDLKSIENLVHKSQKEFEICKNCKIRLRCKHLCPCKNYILTQDINGLSPLICETEKILVEIADDLGKRLYDKNCKLFIQKFYNKNYDLLNYLAKNK